MCEEETLLNMTNLQSKRYLDDDRDYKKEEELITKYLLLYVAFRQFILLNYV